MMWLMFPIIVYSTVLTSTCFGRKKENGEEGRENDRNKEIKQRISKEARQNI